MKAWEIIAYTYDAAFHCEGCARDRFGSKLEDSENPPEDGEGNPVHPVFASDELDGGEICDDCKGSIND